MMLEWLITCLCVGCLCGRKKSWKRIRVSRNDGWKKTPRYMHTQDRSVADSVAGMGNVWLGHEGQGWST